MTVGDSDARRAAGVGEGRFDLLGRTPDEIAAGLGDLLDLPYRARQIYDALYRQGARHPEEITTLGVDLRRRLAERCVIGVPRVTEARESDDGTRKVLFALGDGVTIEAVDIPSRWGSTLCLSSQAGCALACRFCVTGFWGAGRDLSAGEIVGQVLGLVGKLPFDRQRLNIVMMGMGEPLANVANVRRALEILSEAVSWRRMTLSTVGLVEGIRELAAWPKRPNLAVSLHAPDDRRRSRIMPINRTHPIAELFEALAEYPLERRRKITFEYLLIRDFNDAPADAESLGALLADLPSKVNLIPINPDPVLGDAMVPPPPERVEAFVGRLTALGLPTTVRRRRGDDVSAACGQLRAGDRDPQGFRRSNLSW